MPVSVSVPVPVSVSVSVSVSAPVSVPVSVSVSVCDRSLVLLRLPSGVFVCFAMIFCFLPHIGVLIVEYRSIYKFDDEIAEMVSVSNV